MLDTILMYLVPCQVSLLISFTLACLEGHRDFHGKWISNKCGIFKNVYFIPDNDALTWIVVKTMHYCWLKRTSFMRADLNSCLAFLGAETRILKETKHSDIAKEIAVIINPLAFQL